METPTAQRRGTKPPEARRAEILAAAACLFHERGYDATTVQNIAAAAGVATGTVYLYFASKEHVLHALHADFHAGVEAAMKDAFDDVWQRVEAGELPLGAPLALMIDPMVDAVVGYMRSHPVESAVMWRYMPRIHHEAESEDEHTAGYVAAAIEFGREHGKVAVRDPEMAAVLMASALGRPLLGMVVERDDADVERLAAQAKEFFVKSLEARD